MMNKIKDDLRLKAIKEAFLTNTPDEISDLDELHDALVEEGIADEPTSEQLRSLFMLLPANIIGSGISWGFSDTEVRSSIYEFVKENRQSVVSAVSVAVLNAK